MLLKCEHCVRMILEQCILRIYSHNGFFILRTKLSIRFSLLSIGLITTSLMSTRSFSFILLLVFIKMFTSINLIMLKRSLPVWFSGIMLKVPYFSNTLALPCIRTRHCHSASIIILHIVLSDKSPHLFYRQIFIASVIP